MNALSALCMALVAALGLFARAPAPPAQVGSAGASPHQVLTDRQRVMFVAASQVGTVEKTGRNDGEVVKYLTAVGLTKGDPYCAAFVFWCGREALGANNPFPRSGYSPDFVRQPGWLQGRGPTPEAGDTFGIYFSSKGRVAHTGFVAGVKGRSITTIEANTSEPISGLGGSLAPPTESDRNGDGVWRKIRPLSTIHSIKRWM